MGIDSFSRTIVDKRLQASALLVSEEEILSGDHLGRNEEWIDESTKDRRKHYHWHIAKYPQGVKRLLNSKFCATVVPVLLWPSVAKFPLGLTRIY